MQSQQQRRCSAVGCWMYDKHMLRSRVRKFRDVMTQDDRTVDPGDERGEMATVSPVRVTGTSLGRTGANDECPSQKCTAGEHWRPGVSSRPTSVPWNGRKLALKPMMVTGGSTSESLSSEGRV